MNQEKAGKMIKQTQPYGCGLYAVANVFGLNDFVTNERLKLSENGLAIGHLNNFLYEDKRNILIDVFFHAHDGNEEIPQIYISYRPEDDKKILPILLAVKRKEDGKRHMVSGHIHNGGQFTLFDSLKDDSISMHFEDINSKYKFITGMFCFIDNNCKFILLDKK